MADRGSRGLLAVIVGVILASGAAVGQVQPPPRPRVFRIQVVDEETGRGVPLVELRTVNQVRYVTDSNGVVAFDEPGLFNLKVFFTVTSHGYEAAKDNFGYRGIGAASDRGGIGADLRPPPEHRRAALSRHGGGHLPG